MTRTVLAASPRTILRPASIRLTKAALAGLFICGACTLLARLHWALELFSHFVPLYFACALGAFALLTALRERRGAVLALALSIYFGIPLLPYLPLKRSTGDEVTIRVMLANVYTPNRDFAAFRSEVYRHNPDILCLQETDAAWQRVLQGMRTTYPHQVVIPRPDNFGVALLSRWPITEAKQIELGRSTVPALEATVETPYGSLQILNIHTIPPVVGHYAASRNRQLVDAAAIAAAADGPFAIIGELNVTPWSPHFRDLLRNSGLKDARRARGILPTWPVGRPIPTLLPIDHVLVSPDIEVTGMVRGGPFNSDHLPLIADLRLSETNDQAPR